MFRNKTILHGGPCTFLQGGGQKLEVTPLVVYTVPLLDRRLRRTVVIAAVGVSAVDRGRCLWTGLTLNLIFSAS